MFSRIIGKDSIFKALSQNENAPIDSFAFLLIIGRLYIPAFFFLRPIQKGLEVAGRQGE